MLHPDQLLCNSRWACPAELDHATGWTARTLPLCRRFQRFKFKYNLYKLREERAIKPSTFGRLVSATLYEKRFASDKPPFPVSMFGFHDAMR